MNRVGLISSVFVIIGTVTAWLQPGFNDVKIYFMPTTYLWIVLIAGLSSLSWTVRNLKNSKRRIVNLITGLIIISVLGRYFYPRLFMDDLAKIPVGSVLQNNLFRAALLILVIGTFGLIYNGIMKPKKII